MFSKETTMSILNQYEQLKNELKRILKIMDSFSRNITDIDFHEAHADFHVSYEDCCMGCWGHNDVNIPFELVGQSDDVIHEFIKAKRKREKQESDEQYMKEKREKELRQLKELSQKYPDAM